MQYQKAFDTNQPIRKMKKHIHALETQWNESTNPITASRLHNQIKGAQAMLQVLKDEVKAQEPRPIPKPNASNYKNTRAVFLSQCG